MMMRFARVLVPCLGSLVLLVEGSPIPEDPWGVYDGLMPSESWTDGWTPSSASIWSYVPETTTNPTVDGTCGAAYETVCNGDGDSPCCSLFGWCGSGPEFCGGGCQAGYGKCETNDVPDIVNVTADGTCGGEKGWTCKGSAIGGCCSSYGWCGNSDDHCGLGCQEVYGICSNVFSSAPAPLESAVPLTNPPLSGADSTVIIASTVIVVPVPVSEGPLISSDVPIPTTTYVDVESIIPPVGPGEHSLMSVLSDYPPEITTHIESLVGSVDTSIPTTPAESWLGYQSGGNYVHSKSKSKKKKTTSVFHQIEESAIPVPETIVSGVGISEIPTASVLGPVEESSIPVPDIVVSDVSIGNIPTASIEGPAEVSFVPVPDIIVSDVGIGDIPTASIVGPVEESIIPALTQDTPGGVITDTPEMTSGVHFTLEETPNVAISQILSSKEVLLSYAPAVTESPISWVSLPITKSLRPQWGINPMSVFFAEDNHPWSAFPKEWPGAPKATPPTHFKGPYPTHTKVNLPFLKESHASKPTKPAFLPNMPDEFWKRRLPIEKGILRTGTGKIIPTDLFTEAPAVAKSVSRKHITVYTDWTTKAKKKASKTIKAVASSADGE